MPLSISLELQMAFIRCFLPFTVLLRQLQWSSVDAESEQGVCITFSNIKRLEIVLPTFKGARDNRFKLKEAKFSQI